MTRSKLMPSESNIATVRSAPEAALIGYQVPMSSAFDKGGNILYIEYGREQELLDICDELPSLDRIKAMIGRLKSAVVREMAEDLFSDGVRLCKQETDVLYFARTLKSWGTTSEILVTTTPSHLKSILKAREELREAAEQRSVS